MSDSIEVQVARIDERTEAMCEALDAHLDACVTRAEFDPVKKAVYWAVGLLGGSVLIALVALVVKR